MAQAQTNAQADNKEDDTDEFWSAHCKAERSWARLAELLPYGKYSPEAQGHRQLVAQQTQALHLARLEEAGKETEEPNSIGYIKRASLCMEPYPNGRLGSCSKSYSTDDRHLAKIEEERLSILGRTLPKCFPIT